MSLRIKFRSASVDQFIERYAVDVSRGGIFIRTREPLAVGTQLRFDFQLQDAAPLLAGEGTVVWIRENDPARAGVTPGMGVRFDKLTPASQPVLEKILAEKARREQSGVPAKTGPAGGMAVRRPSSTFSALDPAAARAAATAASGPPRVGGLSPLAAGAQPRATAPATGSGPIGAQPRATAPAVGSSSDVFGAQPRAAAPATGSGPVSARARTAETAVPAGIPALESSGAFGRPRTTTGMNAQRPAPAPSSLFEKPTADDIDRALSMLTEVDGPAPAPVPVPVDFSSRVRRPTDAQPVVVEATPDVGDAPKAAHRRTTDAQPMVLESSPDVGDAPSRRSTGTRPLFSGTNELKVPTVPVVPIGDPEPLLDQLEDEEEEDDATSAWVGSGPTRVGGATTEPELPASKPASAAPPKIPAPPSLSLDAAPPIATTAAPGAKPAAPAAPPLLMAPPVATPPKKGSGGALAIIAVLAVVVGGAAFYFLKGPGRAMVSPTASAPATTAAPEGTVPAAAPEGTAPSAVANAADASAAAPDKPTDAAVIGSGATPSTLRARPAGEPPKEATREAKPSEANPGEAKPAEAKPTEAKPAEAKAEPKTERAAHRGKRRAAEATADAPEGAPAAVADVSAPTAADAPAADSAGKEPAKAAGGAHVVKITSSPAGAEVIIDGNSVGTTPYSGGDVDPALPHSITVKKDGYEAYEHMIGGSDWPRPKNGARTLKLNAKLRATGGGDSAKPAESDTPAETTPGLGTTPASPKRE